MLHQTRSVRPVSGTRRGVFIGHTHSNLSESGDVSSMIHYRSARNIGRRRASDGPRPVTPRILHPPCVQVWCALDASGVDQHSVWCYCFRCERMLAVGGNGRVQTDNDTWLSFEHRTMGLSVWWLPTACSVPMSFVQ